jgi:hypothetical protein
MRGSETRWDDRTAARIQALVERATGMPCPCKRGLICPFLPHSDRGAAADADRRGSSSESIEVHAG